MTHIAWREYNVETGEHLQLSTHVYSPPKQHVARKLKNQIIASDNYNRSLYCHCVLKYYTM